LDCPDFTNFAETLHEGHNFIEVGQVDRGVVEKGQEIDWYGWFLLNFSHFRFVIDDVSQLVRYISLNKRLKIIGSAIFFLR
jgi:hypothetical protein